MVKKDEKLIHWFNDFKKGQTTRKIKSSELKELNTKWKVSTNFSTALVRSGVITRIRRGEYNIEKTLDSISIKKAKKEMAKIAKNCISKKNKQKQKINARAVCKNRSLLKDFKPIKQTLLQKIKNWFKTIF
jgi:DNA-nicking Smr family endonuclease